MQRRLILLGAALTAALALSACGFGVQSPDLFVLTRLGPGSRLSIVVNDGGTIRCNGSKPLSLSDPMLLSARDLAAALDKDAKAHLRLSARPGSVFTYTVTLQDGTFRFPDTAAGTRRELAQAELFAVQAAQGPCAGHTGAA